MANSIHVASEHLRDEVVLVDLGHATVVSDHPAGMGGARRGPMPGELMKAAIASSIAIAIGRDAADRYDLPIETVAVHTSSLTAWERLDGPLRTLTYLPKFTTRVVVAGALDADQLAIIERYAAGCGIVQTLCNGVAIDESNSFRAGAGAGVVRDARGNREVIDHFFSSPPPEGERRITPGAPGSGVTAHYLGDGRALVYWARSGYLVDDSGGDASERRGARPEELLLASLCACTCVFTARAASLVASRVEIRVAATGQLDGSRITAMAKTLEVTGAVTDAQREALAFFADHCSLGETLRRGAQMNQEIVALGAVAGGASSDRTSARRALAAQAVERARAQDCDDGLCCVPDH